MFKCQECRGLIVRKLTNINHHSTHRSNEKRYINMVINDKKIIQ